MKKVKYTRRVKSLFSGCELEDLYMIKDFPIHMLEESRSSADDPCCDMVFSIGKGDGFIELRNTISPELLYKDAHSNALGRVWRGAHEAIAALLVEGCDASIQLLEIGGGNGHLNALFNEMGGTVAQWVIAEPQPSPVEGCTAEFITGFFPECMPDKNRYDIIVHTHVIEHMESIKGFLDDVKGHLRKDGKMIFSLPDMQPMLRKKMTSIINFEHSFLITETYLDLFLKESGFRIDSKLHYGDGHSLIYETTYTGREEKLAACDLYASNKKGFLEYIRYHEELVRNWNEKMERETRKIYLFGGHITTQYFVGYGLNIAGIESILDNDIQKHGKRVGGIDKRIQSPKVLAGEDEAVVIIPNSPYATEIEEDIVKNINPKVEFWT